MEEAINHPQTKERQMVLHKDDYQGIASPIKFSRSKSVGVKNIPPQIGEHTNEILLELNYTKGEIENLVSSHVVKLTSSSD